MSDPIVIVSAARTPMGSFQGDFTPLAAHDLGGERREVALKTAHGGAGGGNDDDGVGHERSSLK